LPQGEDVLLSVEDYRFIDELEVELTGPDGSQIPLERRKEMSKSGSRKAVHNLHQLAHGKTAVAGTHRVTVRAPQSDQPLVIVVGADMSVGEALEVFPGGKLLGRLRGR
jgi:hypothetical protein